MTSGAACHFPSVSVLIRTRMWKCTKFPSRMGRGAVFFLSAFYFCYYDCITARLCSVWKGESLTLIPLFSNAWESLRTHFRVGACLVLDVFPNSTLGPQCSRDFYYTASTALGKLKVIFSTCVLLLLDRTPVFLALLNGLTFKAV